MNFTSYGVVAALALAWAGVPAFADPYTWGDNSSGQLGDGTYADRSLPGTVDLTGVLAGKTLTAISTRGSHCLALDSDGKVYAWGNNDHGQLGDDSTTTRSEAVAVDRSGALSGKVIKAVAAGEGHSLVLTEDGKLYAWGNNTDGQLGNGTTVDRHVPGEVDMSGALSGKTVSAIASGAATCMALTSRGKVFGWGSNGAGSIGDGTNISRSTPVALDTSGVLATKTIVSIAAGYAVSSDGQLYSWGTNGLGQLGDGTTTSSNSPVAVDMSGALLGKSMVAVASAGGSTAMALTSEGEVYSWGWGLFGILGNGSDLMQLTPVAVDTSGVLSGKKITAISAGLHALALSQDGELFAWGNNPSGALGYKSSSLWSNVPVKVDTSGVLAGQSVTAIAAGYTHSLVLASPSSTTITPASRTSYAANFGWLDWRWSATSAHAPVVTSHLLSGKVYASNPGWIDLGNGLPANGIRYSQTAGDTGVNHDGAGALTGFAYGANIGWIRFAQSWNHAPRIDLTTGEMTGYAYSANCGWIGLRGLKTKLAAGRDTDSAGGQTGDGIPDAWELEQLANAGLPSDLTQLGNSPAADADHDGATDYDEYLADTNPFSGASLPVPPALGSNPNGSLTLSWDASPRRAYQVRCSQDLSTWLPEGAPVTGSSVLIPVPPETQRMFFRVEAHLPLSQ